MSLPANRQKMAGAHIDKVTSSRHRGDWWKSALTRQGEKQESRKEWNTTNNSSNFVAVSFGVGCVKHNWRNYGKGTSFLFTVPRQ